MRINLKLFLAFVLFIAVGGLTEPALAETPTVPTLVSFTISPDTVDIATAKTTINLNLIVNNPGGISSKQTLVTISDGANNVVVVPITRTDSPVNYSLQTVEFKATYTVGATLPAGVYKAVAAPIYSLTSIGGQGYPTPPLIATTTSTVIGATNSLLIRSGGYLNYSYPTFVGPSFNRQIAHEFTNPKYNSIAAPIWKVGESFNPNDYYELAVPSIPLMVKATTQSVCVSDGTTLKLISTGDCGFVVYTNKTLDYQYNEDNEVVRVTEARIKPTFSLPPVETQSSANLPLTIPGPLVFVPSKFGLVVPTSSTPTVCYPVGSYITIISGGTCTLKYSTPATADYLASDVYPITFQITRTPQSISFRPPGTANLATHTLLLSATSTSGGLVTFNSSTLDICVVTGNSLKLLRVGNCQVEAAQAGSATLSPASLAQSIVVTTSAKSEKMKPVVKRVECLQNGKSQFFHSAKCPKGYKKK